MRNPRCLLTLFIPFILLNCTSDNSQNQLTTDNSSIISASDTSGNASLIGSDSMSVQSATIADDNKTASSIKPRTISEQDRIENEQFRIAELKRREALRSGRDISEITLEDIGEKPYVSLEGAKFEKVYTPTADPQKQKKKEVVAKPVVKETKTAKKTNKPVDQKSKKGTPIITFETREYSFDTLIEGDVINYSFKFKNTGNAPFEVVSAQASCGCTRPSFPFLPIEPGQEGVIGVTYDSRTKSGEQIPKIEVQTDFQDYPIALFLKGYVKDKPKAKVETEEVKVETDGQN